MSRELDCRDFSSIKLTSAREAELNTLASYVSDSLPGKHRIKITSFDAASGNPSAIASESTQAVKGDYVNRALEHARSIGSALGLAANQAAEFEKDPDFQTTSSGAVSVHLQQNYKGIPVFEAARTVLEKG